MFRFTFAAQYYVNHNILDCKVHTTVLLLGGNLGPVAAHFEKAERLLRPVLEIRDRSSIHRTAPWRMPGAPPFLNQAWCCRTRLAPNELLTKLQAVEQKLGRVPQTGAGYQNRPLDIDIIFYEDRIMDEPGLKIPHPEMTRRHFVLAPMVEIVPNYPHPQLNKSVKTLLREIE